MKRLLAVLVATTVVGAVLWSALSNGRVAAESPGTASRAPTAAQPVERGEALLDDDSRVERAASSALPEPRELPAVEAPHPRPSQAILDASVRALPFPELEALEPEHRATMQFIDEGGAPIADLELLLTRPTPGPMESYVHQARTDSQGSVSFDVRLRPWSFSFVDCEYVVEGAKGVSVHSTGVTHHLNFDSEVVQPGTVLEIHCKAIRAPRLRLVDIHTGDLVANAWMGRATVKYSDSYSVRKRRGGMYVATRKESRGREATLPLHRVGDAYAMTWRFVDGPRPEPPPGFDLEKAGPRSFFFGAPAYRTILVDDLDRWGERWEFGEYNDDVLEFGLEPFEPVGLIVEQSPGVPFPNPLALLERLTVNQVGVWDPESGADGPILIDPMLLETFTAAPQTESGAAVSNLALFDIEHGSELEPESWSIEPAGLDSDADFILRVKLGGVTFRFDGAPAPIAARESGLARTVLHADLASGTATFPAMLPGEWWFGPPEALPIVSKFASMNGHLEQFPLARMAFPFDSAEEAAESAGLVKLEIGAEGLDMQSPWGDTRDGIRGQVNARGIDPTDLSVRFSYLPREVPIRYEELGHHPVPVQSDGRFELPGLRVAPHSWIVTVDADPGAGGNAGPKMLAAGDLDRAISVRPAGLRIISRVDAPVRVTLKTQVDGRWAERPDWIGKFEARGQRTWWPLPPGEHDIQVDVWGKRRKIELLEGHTLEIAIDSERYRELGDD